MRLPFSARVPVRPAGIYIKYLIPPQLYPALLAAALAVTCAIAGALAGAGAGRARIFVPVSGALLLSVAAFGMAPELVRTAGWLPAAGLGAAAYVLLSLVDAHAWPLCPSASHGATFAASLSVATALHAFVDGWGLSVVRASWSGAIPAAVFMAIMLHKAPEGLALGAMLRASMPVPANALALAVGVELMTVAGGAVGLLSPPSGWSRYPLALATGAFLFLGTHALRGPKHGAHASRDRDSARASSSGE